LHLGGGCGGRCLIFFRIKGTSGFELLGGKHQRIDGSWAKNPWFKAPGCFVQKAGKDQIFLWLHKNFFKKTLQF